MAEVFPAPPGGAADLHGEDHDHKAPSAQPPAEREPRNPVTWLILGIVRAYQLVVSPWLPRTCKYYPSCSAYAVTALHRHGAAKGTVLAGWRLLRCNPWSLGGVDHVPARGAWKVSADVDEGS